MILLTLLGVNAGAFAWIGAAEFADAHGSALQLGSAALAFACAVCTTSLALQQRARIRRTRGGA